MTREGREAIGGEASGNNSPGMSKILFNKTHTH